MKLLRQTLGFIGWSALAALVPVVMYLLMVRNPRIEGVWYGFIRSFIYSVMIGVPLTIALPKIAPVLHGRLSTPRLIGAYGLILGGFAVAGTVVGACLVLLLDGKTWSAYPGVVRGSLPWSLVLTYGFGVSGLLWGTMQHRLHTMNEQLRKKEFDEQSARLASLESRVHPHFLFNAINSILSLIRDDPARAEQLLERMAALLRVSLDQDQRSLVPLGQELKLARDYLEIEQARFDQRLRFRFEIPENLAGVEVPPFSIQTLVENSVKYAISPSRMGGEIVVTAHSRDGELRVEVSDQGPGFDADALTSGHGLELLRSRLTALFGDRAALEFERHDGMVVRMRIPAPVMHQ